MKHEGRIILERKSGVAKSGEAKKRGREERSRLISGRGVRRNDDEKKKERKKGRKKRTVE